MCYDYVGSKGCAFFFFSCLLDFFGMGSPVVLQNGERDYVDGFGWREKRVANQGLATWECRSD